MTIQDKAKKLLKILKPSDYRYVLAEIVSRTKTELLRNNSVLMVERTYAEYFGTAK
jgi:hypothetical protein